MTLKNIHVILTASLISVLTVMTACENRQVTTVNGIIWGTTYHITTIGDAEADPVTIATLTLDSLNGSLNMFDSTSELGRFNSEGQLTASADFMTVLDESRQICRLTGGAFDPTVGPLIEYWGFGTSKDFADTVDMARVERIKSAVGLDKIDVSGNRIARKCDLTRLDFGAIAKGYAVDRVTEALLKAGYSGAMVEIGGEVRVAGKKPEGQAWRIQIDAPVRDTSGTHVRLGILSLTDGAVATSGNYRNFRELSDGRIVGHTISPVTGTPVETDVMSATIIAKSCMKADALATAVMVMGSERSTRLLDSLTRSEESGVLGAILVTSKGINTIGLPSPHAVFEPANSVSFRNYFTHSSGLSLVRSFLTSK
ncbi:MAG: FAD:protein FMN transferase [Muribaculaceae bacterium]|nr:FAD:protein FMN transferase [Muribaculaceae bacterium]